MLLSMAFTNKNITTGEGGMVVTRDPEIAKKIESNAVAWHKY